MRAGYDPVVVAPIDSAAEHRMSSLSVDHIPVRIDRSGLTPLRDLQLFLSYRSIFRCISPRAFLGFTIKPNIYGCIAARLRGVPAIANISGLGTVFVRRGPLMWLVNCMYRVALRRAKVVFFQNPDDLDLFIGKRIVRSDQAQLLPGSGIDLIRYTPSPIPPGPLTFLLIARLLRDKGIREYVEAAVHLRADYPEVKFQLLGPLDTDNRTSIQQPELDRWVTKGAIEYLGATDDVRPFISAATVIVLPSNYREGVPRSLLEGAAMGRPLISTDMPGCREIVEHTKNGLLCEPRNVQSMANSMRNFIGMAPEQRQVMGTAARVTVEQRFSEELVIRAYLDALKAVV
jgi:glycosyltransferase involved in cell wall biosynthesis